MIRYTADFKNKVCNEYHSGTSSKSEIQRKYDIKGHDRLKQWLENFPFFDEPSINHLQLITPSTKGQSKSELEDRIKALEKDLEESQLKQEAYRMMIDIAEKQFKINIKKK
jgi:transposase-like protein